MNALLSGWGRVVSRVVLGATVFLLPVAAVAQSNVKAGAGTVVGSNISHPNGNVYDQVLMTGPTVTVAADPGQVVRVSFLDLNDDIAQVEFAGAGTVTITLDSGSYRPPAAPLKYNQPDVRYVKGVPTVHVQGAGPDTFISIFSVGRGNAVNSALFPAGMNYDAMADVSLLQIDGAQAGGVLTGNVRYSATSGVTGISAPNTAVRCRVVVGDIDAQANATPVMRIGQASSLEWDAGAMLVAGGRLQESNGSPIDATTATGASWPRINTVGGTLSSGEQVPAGTIQSQFVSGTPGSMSVNGVPRATRGYVPASFDELLGESGINAFYFGPDESLHFSGWNVGTYAITMNTAIEGEMVHVRLDGGYSYAVDGANQNRMTFSMTLGTVTMESASVYYRGTIMDLAQRSGEIMPVRITAVASFASAVSGTATMTVLYSTGAVESRSSAFDADHELDFGLF